MRLITRRLALAALVAALLLTWNAHIAQDVVVAQTRRPVKVTRIYAGRDGLSHAQAIEMPTTGTGGVTEMIEATGVQFSVRPPGPASQWHVGSMRQYVITLSGRGEIEVSDGKVVVGPGHFNLIEDTTRKGHITRNLGPEDRVVVTIPLADQTVTGADQ